MAAGYLTAGEVVGIPTETVYGLAANALNAEAVAKIYAVKGRPENNPIIVHVASVEMIHQCVSCWPEEARRLAEAFWPGPLTLILPKRPEIPSNVSAGGTTVGIRWPGHPFMQAVIHRCGFPLAAPSANPANQVSPTSAAHVLKSLGGLIPLIVDGGQSQVGIESTVVDLSVRPARLLRPGMIHANEISRLVPLETGPQVSGEVLRSPGQLERHYSPKAQLLLLHWKEGADLDRQLRDRGLEGLKTHIVSHTLIPSGRALGAVSVIPHDAEAFARALYAELHRCDDSGVELIVLEALPDLPEWAGIADRLRRASVPI